MTDGDRTVRLAITGQVQGVGFRFWCVREAKRLDLDGWVRNRRDGSVEAVARGPAQAVEAFVEVCRKGPFGAKVDSVAPSDVDPDEAGGGGFSQAPTG